MTAAPAGGSRSPFLRPRKPLDVPMRRNIGIAVGAVVVIGALVLGMVGCDTVPRHVSIVEAVQNSDSEIGLVVDACGGDVRIEVEESRHAVTAKVTAPREWSGDDCLEIVELSLVEPLGDRVIVDGSSGDVVPLTRPKGVSGSPLVGDQPDGESTWMPEVTGAGESETFEFTTEAADFRVVVPCDGQEDLVVTVGDAPEHEVRCDRAAHDLRIGINRRV